MSEMRQSHKPDPDCLFCKMVAREVPAEVVAEDAEAFAFRDINPQAPSHVLVIPKTHAVDVADLALNNASASHAVMTMIAEIGRQEGGEDGFRTVFNTGVLGGQLVYHCHAHVMAGRQFGWPAG